MNNINYNINNNYNIKPISLQFSDKKEEDFSHKYPIKHFSHNNLKHDKTQISLNNYLQSSIQKNIIDQSSFEQTENQLLEKMNENKKIKSKDNHFNLYKEDINLKSILIEKFKMFYFFFCYREKLIIITF